MDLAASEILAAACRLPMTRQLRLALMCKAPRPPLGTEASIGNCPQLQSAWCAAHLVAS